jgi:hypothetical protein
MATAPKANLKIKLPPAHDWRTTDADEINKRRQRAREESFIITNLTPAHPLFYEIDWKLDCHRRAAFDGEWNC